ncbi:MAG: CDP-alcohol phosphatidyltransferase family protein [candidate division WOR-3 bacterium]|nr:CDP-alcohol phosphatidyltransferase family protein [candidate division WOR-3 bacterium]MDH5683223.1 CDP-alcohol phosphatidyltransferase family protein [candidate division WOR-3 bacterium]
MSDKNQSDFSNSEANRSNRIELGKVITLPNFLSISRLFLLPLILLALATNQSITALILMVISWISDALDGYLARKLSLVSNIGKLLDHLVDKIWVGTILVTLVLVRGLPVYVASAVIIRDLLIVIGGSVIANSQKNIISSNFMGKIAGFLFAVLMVLYTLDLEGFEQIKHYLVIAVLVSVVLSFINYLYVFIKTIRQPKLSSDSK